MAIEINTTPIDAEAEAADFAAIAAATEQVMHSARAAEGVFRANARRAAEEIVSLAINAGNERVRLDAAKYIVERVMGKTPDHKDLNPGAGGEGAPWDDIYGTAVVHEPAANMRAITTAAPQSQR